MLEFGWFTFSFCDQSDVVAKIKAEASLLRLTNEDLCKQVEGLQISRLNEVEELAYLRWVNSCLRNELKNTCSALNSDKPSSPHSVVSSSGDCVSSFSDQATRYSNCGSENRFNMVKKPKKWPITSDHLSQVEFQGSLIRKNWIESDVGGSPRRRHSISGSNYSEEEGLEFSEDFWWFIMNLFAHYFLAYSLLIGSVSKDGAIRKEIQYVKSVIKLGLFSIHSWYFVFFMSYLKLKLQMMSYISFFQEFSLNYSLPTVRSNAIMAIEIR